MSEVQPDLFGEYDAERARIEAEHLPQACPHCGTVEPNAFLLQNNHFPNPRYGVQMCIAQTLTVSHIAYAARNGLEQLPGYLERGRELGLDVDAILAQVAS